MATILTQTGGMRQRTAGGKTPVHSRDVAVDFAGYDQHEATIAVIMNVLFVRHLIDTYHAFDGDLVEAIVLGEIAHHNVAATRTLDSDVRDLGRRLAGDAVRRVLLPTNAYSIAEASGIPRETVRRKVASLERRGWIVREAVGDLYVTSRPQAHFSALNRALFAELLETARAIEGLLASKDVEKPARRAHPSRTRPARTRSRSGTRR